MNLEAAQIESNHGINKQDSFNARRSRNILYPFLSKAEYMSLMRGSIFLIALRL